MKKSYPIEVDCANCANLMEGAIKKIPGISNATVNYMTQKMTVEFNENVSPEQVMGNVIKTCKQIEPDCHIEL